jgi:hypothetical protein
MPGEGAPALTKWMVIPRGVKVLSEKTGNDDNFKNDRLDSELVPVEVESFSNEYRDLLRMN